MTEAEVVAREYAAAHLMPDDRNSKVIVIARDGSRCTPRMARIQNAEDAVMDLNGKGDLPLPVQAFINAESDKGCFGCWVCSNRANTHPKCQAKISRWFAARKDLIEYGTAMQASTAEPKDEPATVNEDQPPTPGVTSHD